MNTQTAKDALIKRLVEEYGLTAREAKGLVDVLGTNWSSLAREARLIRGTRPN